MDLTNNNAVTIALIGLAMLAVAGIIGLAALQAPIPEELGQVATYIVAGIFGGGATAIAGAGVAARMRRNANADWRGDDEEEPDALG